MTKKFIAVVCMLIPAAMFSQDAKMHSFIDALMKKMTLQEKLGQLNLLVGNGDAPVTGSVISTGLDSKIKGDSVGGLFGVIGVEKIRKAQELAMNSGRLHIPLIFGSDIIHGYKTTFPIPLALSCSWDTGLIRRVARIAASEATADGLCWAFSPMVDIARDPRWGRVAEGAGEDPFLGSQVAKAMVKGYQGDNLSSNNTLMACVKHFALYGAAEAGRDYNTVDMSRIKMYEYYLPPYKAAIDAGVGSVMSSFNEIDGIPATGNKWLMTDLLRKQWGFKGLVVTDYTAINEMVNHGVGDLQTCAAIALNAGIDMDMVGQSFDTTLAKSLKQGKVTQKLIDDACRRILEAKYKLGLFDDPYRYCNTERAATEVLSAEKRQAAREIATHCFVLLKNNNQTLPLKKSGTIAVIGPLANDTSNMLGTWAVSGKPRFAIPVLEGINAKVKNAATILYEKGANISDDSLFAKKVNFIGTRIDIDKRTPDEMINEAVRLAYRSDVVLAVVGEASEMSGEAASRSDISLPECQKKLLRALAKTGKPLVLVMMSGRPLAMTEENDLASAILFTWHAGHEAGNAIADVLFGDYNPSGKLTMTFPKNVGQIPIYYNAKNTGRPASPDFHKYQSNYLDVSNTPLYPFGYGLSYTNFTYSEIQLSSSEVTANKPITATVTVSNAGNFDGEETVQLYIFDPVASVTQPLRKLKGFQKIYLKKGESKQVRFTININDLKFFNSELKWIAEPGDFKVYIGPNSRDVKAANFKLKQ